jgi:succinate dehydrogenase/fumarate reductase flavoprotein subunit
VHGADRLAGNSGTDVLVFGARAGKYAAEFSRSAVIPETTSASIEEQVESLQQPNRPGELDLEHLNTLHSELRRVMWEDVGLIREANGLERALGSIQTLADQTRGSRGICWITSTE